MTRAFRRDGNRLLVYLRVTPGASNDAIGGTWRGPGGGERLAVRITAPPDRGKANEAAARLIAKTLRLPKSAVTIVSGGKDRLKTVAIDRDSVEIVDGLAALLADGDSNDDRAGASEQASKENGA